MDRMNVIPGIWYPDAFGRYIFVFFYGTPPGVPGSINVIKLAEPVHAGTESMDRGIDIPAGIS